MQPSPAVPCKNITKHLSSPSAKIHQTLELYLTGKPQRLPAAAPSCTAKKLYQILNFIFHGNSSKIKLHLLALSIRTAFAACLISNRLIYLQFLPSVFKALRCAPLLKIETQKGSILVSLFKALRCAPFLKTPYKNPTNWKIEIISYL